MARATPPISGGATAPVPAGRVRAGGASAAAITGVRSLVWPTTPFALGSQAENPAPSHLLNGLLAAALGISDRGRQTRDFLQSTSTVAPDYAASLTSPDAVARLRQDLLAVFNPDRRIWEGFGALAPLHAWLSTRDATDAEYGPLVWDLVSRNGAPDVEDRLRALFFPTSASDPATALALMLTNGATLTDGSRTTADTSKAWYAAGGTPAGGFLATQLAEFMDGLIVSSSDASRLSRISTLGVATQLVAILAIALGPLAARSSSPIGSVHELAPLVVWGGTPPGDSGHPMVAASSMSLHGIARRTRFALTELLADLLAAQPVPSGGPFSIALESSVRGVLGDAGRTATEAAGDVAALRPAIAGASSYAEAARLLIDFAYPESYVTKAVRTMGRKIGLAAPDRGQLPRFVAETTLLSTLVAGVATVSGMEFRTFIDECRRRFGLVFGPGTKADLANDLGLWEGAGVGAALLAENQELVRHRLVKAGLAREYSDGHTEVAHAWS